MWFLPLIPFFLICTGMVVVGFRERAKYMAAHPEENFDAQKKKA
jgi:hypothetical protein